MQRAPGRPPLPSLSAPSQGLLQGQAERARQPLEVALQGIPIPAPVLRCQAARGLNRPGQTPVRVLPLRQIASSSRLGDGSKALAIVDRRTLDMAALSRHTGIVMRSLMVALKEGQEIERLTAVAARLAEPATEIHVVHVVEIGLPHNRADAHGLVESAAEVVRARGLIANGLVEVMTAGTVAKRLAKVARTSDAEVIVMGSRGLGRLGGLFGRSVSHALLADLGLPVLIVPANAVVPSDGFRRVLAAVRSEDELQAAAAAIRLLQPPVEVMAVHVPRLVAAHSGSAQSSAFIEVPEVSGVVLTETRRRLRRAGIWAATRTLARSEGVAASITEKARSWSADVIVLGSRRLHNWEALIAGSTSHDVLRLSDRPVLISGRSFH